MPNQSELVATGRTEAEIAREIGADLLIYQELEALKTAVRAANPRLTEFEASCFDGKYITGDVTADYLSQLAETATRARRGRRPLEREADERLGRLARPPSGDPREPGTGQPSCRVPALKRWFFGGDRPPIQLCGV